MRLVRWTSFSQAYSAPDCCCRCGGRADTVRKTSFMTSTAGRSATVTISFPICRVCLRPIKIAHRIMAVSAISVLVGMAVLEKLLGRVPEALIPVIVLVLFGSFIVMGTGVLEPVKYAVGTFYFTSDAYADQFAALNGITAEPTPESRYKRWFRKT